MKRIYFYPVIAVICGAFIFVPDVSAQDVSAMEKISEVETLSSAEWQETVEDAKKEIRDLLQENERLTAEYDFLKEKLSSLQSNVLKLKQDVEAKERSNQALEKFQKDQVDVRAKIKKDMGKMKREIADIEKEKEFSLNQLKEEEKKAEFWHSKLSDLQVKKRELTLELKLQEISRQELEQGQDEELDRLKEELAKYQEKEKSLEKELRSLQKEFKKIPSGADKILLKNKELEAKIERVKAQYEQQKRANEELAKKNEEIKEKAENLPKNLVQEKNNLDAEIQKLEDELAQVRGSIEGSAQLAQKKRQLMNEIMRMDIENQELRRKIDELMSGKAVSE